MTNIIKPPSELNNVASELFQNDQFVLERGGLLYSIVGSLIASQGTETAIPGWNISTTYNVDDLVLYNQNKIWKSLQGSNLNHVPVEGAWWTEVSKSESNGFGRYAVGVYTKDPTLVVRLDPSDSKDKLYSLRGTLPFSSTDFATELASGDWQLIGYDKEIKTFTNADLVSYVYTYTHNRNTQNVEMNVYRPDGSLEKIDGIAKIVDANTIDIDFGWDIDAGTWKLILTYIS